MSKAYIMQKISFPILPDGVLTIHTRSKAKRDRLLEAGWCILAQVEGWNISLSTSTVKEEKHSAN